MGVYKGENSVMELRMSLFNNTVFNQEFNLVKPIPEGKKDGQ